MAKSRRRSSIPFAACGALSTTGRACRFLLKHAGPHRASDGQLFTSDMRPVLLDFFCGAGGAAYGYYLKGLRVIGFDTDPTMLRDYPFECVQIDALRALEYLRAVGFLSVGSDLVVLSDVAAIHASPPCQAFSDLQKRSGWQYPELIEPTRELLEEIGKPYIIENVDNAPLRDPVMLCGTMFFTEALRVLRHRLFETNFYVKQPPHPRHPLVFTHDKRKPHYGKLDQNKAFVQVTGGGNCKVEVARRAMGIEWMTKAQLNEAIPPAYTRYIGGYIP